MTTVEIAVLLVAVAFAVLVGCLVPVLIQVRKTVAESEQLLAKLNVEVPGLVAELRSISQNLNEVTELMLDGKDRILPMAHHDQLARLGAQHLAA